jgi:hypothetical protein
MEQLWNYAPYAVIFVGFLSGFLMPATPAPLKTPVAIVETAPPAYTPVADANKADVASTLGT